MEGVPRRWGTTSKDPWASAFVGVRVGHTSTDVCDVTSSQTGKIRRELGTEASLMGCTWSPARGAYSLLVSRLRQWENTKF